MKIQKRRRKVVKFLKEQEECSEMPNICWPTAGQTWRDSHRKEFDMIEMIISSVIP